MYNGGCIPTESAPVTLQRWRADMALCKMVTTFCQSHKLSSWPNFLLTGLGSFLWGCCGTRSMQCNRPVEPSCVLTMNHLTISMYSMEVLTFSAAVQLWWQINGRKEGVLCSKLKIGCLYIGLRSSRSCYCPSNYPLLEIWSRNNIDSVAEPACFLTGARAEVSSWLWLQIHQKKIIHKIFKNSFYYKFLYHYLGSVLKFLTN